MIIEKNILRIGRKIIGKNWLSIIENGMRKIRNVFGREEELDG